MKKKYYVVWAGRNKGVFKTWEECKEQVDGYSNAKYKSFTCIQLAMESYKNGYEAYRKVSKIKVKTHRNSHESYDKNLPEERDKEIFIYSLKLNNNKYYIGQSSDPDKRIKKQFKGKGSAWTKEHKPIELLDCWNTKNKNWKTVEIFENIETLKFMAKYGWKNVRGGFWTNISNSDTYKNLLHHRESIIKLGFDVNEKEKTIQINKEKGFSNKGQSISKEIKA